MLFRGWGIGQLYVDEHLERGSAIYPVDRQKLSKLKVLR